MNLSYLTNIGKTSQKGEDSLLLAEQDKEPRIIQANLTKAVTLPISPTLLAVSDGIAGLKYGEVASTLTLSFLAQIIQKDSAIPTAKAIRIAQERLSMYAFKKPKYSGMGATLAGVRFFEDEAHVFNVGDSRVYLFRDGKLSQLSIDHTLARKMALEGEIADEKEAANAYKLLNSAIIASDDEGDFEISTTKIELNGGDKLLICTDGLSDMVDDATIQKYFLKYDDSGELVTKLYQKAMRNGGLDNISLIVCF